MNREPRSTVQMSNRRADRLRERMSMRSGKFSQDKDRNRPHTTTEIPERMDALQKQRKSFAHMRQSLIVPPRPLEWWEKEVVEYAFSHPHVRLRMERLMGSNITRLTDRRYMQRLAERIQEEHEQALERRIRAREVAEVEREKKLILEGKIPVEQVPHELADHPVFKISRITSQAIETRRSKMQSTMRMSYIPQDALSALAKAINTGGPPEEELQAVHDHEQVAEYEAEQKAQQAKEAATTTAAAIADLAVTASEFKEDTKGIMLDILDLADSAAEEGFEKKKARLALLAEEMGEISSEEEGGTPVSTEGVERIPSGDLPPIFEGGFPLEELLGEIEVSSPRIPSPKRDEESEKREAVLRAARERREHRRRERKNVEMADSEQSSDDDDFETLGRQASMAAQRAEWQAEQEAEELAQQERDHQYTLSDEEFKRLKYESPLIEELRKKETVAELYELADEIVGGLWLGKAQRPSQLPGLVPDSPTAKSQDSMIF